MDFIAPSSWLATEAVSTAVSVAVIVLVAMLVALFFRIITERLPEKTTSTVLRFMLAFAVAAVSALCLFAASSHARGELGEERISAIESVYGIELSHTELQGLAYPDSKPEANTEVFGTAEYEGLNIRLVWEDGEMRLQGAVRETFEELPVVNR